MSLRILGGKAKGTELSVPKGDLIRPTSVLLRRKIFDSYQRALPLVLVDAFGGSGAVGLEGLSRGVERVYLCEKNPNVYKTLKSNCEKLEKKMGSKVRTFKGTFEKYISKFKNEYLNFTEEYQQETVVFFDPPYELHDLYKTFLDTNFFNDSWFKGVLWIESDKNKGLPKSFWEEKLNKTLKSFDHSDSYVVVIDLEQQ